MICRACLRTNGAFAAAETFPAQGLLHRRAVQRWSLSAVASSRSRCEPSIYSLRRDRLQKGTPPSAYNRLFTTSAASSSAPAQPSQPMSTSVGDLEKPSFLSEGESQVWDRLVAEFAPTQLVVQDISGGCGSMYGIDISSEKFRGLNMLKQQRLVNAALGDLMRDWHGVQLKTRAP
ncbi:Altered inheritance of mitochondria protein 1 [Madurella fahalii]|uniref:Altered inheritance of mitochondria protein 1 n=1 Tax=Madurella fahalii TaxID=1157608 RepID=A0ABQ0GQ20_9PEZI